MEFVFDENYKCPVEFTLSILGGKWKPVILWRIACDEVKRYGELKRQLVAITHKMLSQQLKELESDGLIHREEYHQIPPKVEYSLTEKGKTLLPLLRFMYEWGMKNMNLSDT